MRIATCCGRCRQALAPRGRVVIQDFILEEDKTAPKMAALFSLNMLVGTERGASYNESEYAAWLAEAGFHDADPHPPARPQRAHGGPSGLTRRNFRAPRFVLLI